MEWFLIAICVVLVVLPNRYDPAIRWKERNEQMRREREANHE